ncbi:MAG: ABC transporter permease, partial [Polaromonas sp.]
MNTSTRFFRATRRVWGHPSIVIGGGLVILVALVALLAGILSPYDPLASNFRLKLQ